ncbi:MAG: DMT family transporter [Pseudomonadota bacterium]
MSASTKGALLSLLAFAIFAGHDALIKVLGGGYSAFQIIFFSVLFAFPLTTLMLVQDTTSGTLIPKRPVWTGVRTGAVVISTICAFYAFSVLPLAQVYAILFSTPLLITALSVPLLGEVVRLRRWVAVAVGLGGVIVVLQPAQIELEWGHGAALLGAAMGALSSTIVRKIGREERPVVLLIYPMLAQFGLMCAALPFVFVPMQGGALALIACLAILGHIAMRLMIKAYSVAEASTVAPMQFSQILWASLFGILFFEEMPSLTTAIGAGIVIASGLYILLRERSGASANSPVTATRSRVVAGVHPRIGPQVDAAKDDT